MNIAVVGTGYVGTAHTMLLAQHNTVIDRDVDTERVAMINRSEPTVDNAEMSAFSRQRLWISEPPPLVRKPIGVPISSSLQHLRTMISKPIFLTQAA